MSWVSRGVDRWEWTADPEPHYLVRHESGLMVELHGATVHAYRLGPAGLFPLEPLGGTEHVLTNTNAPTFATPDEAFTWLEGVRIEGEE